MSFIPVEMRLTKEEYAMANSLTMAEIEQLFDDLEGSPKQDRTPNYNPPVPLAGSRCSFYMTNRVSEQTVMDVNNPSVMSSTNSHKIQSPIVQTQQVSQSLRISSNQY